MGTSQEIGSKAIRMAREWMQTQELAEYPTEKRRANMEGTRCEVVCKADATWHQERRLAGVTWESQIVSNVKSPLVAEGIALLTAMETAVSLDFKQILLSPNRVV